jgi:hypothetical protein
MQYLHFEPFQKYACGVQAFVYEDPTLNAIPHFGPFRKYACGVQASVYEDPTLNAIPAFWAISKVCMLGLSIFIRRSYPKCNTVASRLSTHPFKYASR